MKNLILLLSFLSSPTFAAEISGWYKCEQKDSSHIVAVNINQSTIDVNYLNPHFMMTDRQHLYGSLENNNASFSKYEFNSMTMSISNATGQVSSLNETEIELTAPAQINLPTLKTVAASENITLKCGK